MSQTRAATARLARLARIQSRHPQAVQYFTEGWGGPQSAERAEALVKDIVDLFVEGDDVWKDDVEILLEEYMEVCFNTICEDDSLDELGIKFCDMWKECIEGKTDMVSAELGKEYQRHEMVSRSKGLDTGDADDGSDDGEMNEAAEELIQETVAQALSAGGDGMEIEGESESLKQKTHPPIRDADGWETVARGKKAANKKK
eukprot:gene20438-23215_t